MTASSNRPGLLLAASLMLLITACNFGGGGGTPEASLTVEPERGPVPLDVLVDSSGSGFDDGREVRRELSVNGGAFERIEELHGISFDEPGEYRLELKVSAGNGNSASAATTVVAEPSAAEGSGFDMKVAYAQGEWGDRERQALEIAAERWSEVVIGDLPDVMVQSSHVESACGSGLRYSGLIDDLLLFASLRDIDGAGGVVGMAGSCLLRSDGFPLVGLIVLDRADIDFLTSSHNLSTVILHELGHVLDLNHGGWNRRGLLHHDRTHCLDSSLVEFTGPEAANQYWRIGGSGRVPVEANGVSGTACSHWDEDTFRTELMTGYLDSQSRLSRVTIGALQDMGYEVSFDAADSYSLSSSGLQTHGAHLEVAERLLPVGGILDEDGNFHPLPEAAPADQKLRLGGGHAH